MSAESVASFVSGFFYLLQLLILGRILYSWVDPNPYPTNELKRWLWMLTEPILAPFRRVIPPLGMFDISALVALLVLQVVGQVLANAIYPY